LIEKHCFDLNVLLWLSNSWFTRLTGFKEFELSPGFHITSVNALAKINKQRTEKKEAAHWRSSDSGERPTVT